MPPGMLCRAVQELCRCLALLIESGNQVDLEMLDVARMDPTAPTSTDRAPLPTPRVEQLIGVHTPSDPPAFEPEEVVQPKEMTLVRRRPLAPLGLHFCR